MTITMRLHPEPFAEIKSGKKKIEIRINDEKRQQFQLGDEIEFSKRPELKEKIHVKIIGLLKYTSFADLFADFPLEYFGGGFKEKAELLKLTYSFYSKEEENEFGVLGINLN